MSSIEKGAHYETVSAKPAASKTSILTCPAGRTWYVILSVTVCASDAAAGTVDVFRTNAAGTEYTISKAGVVPAAGNYQVPGVEGLTLQAGDILKVTPSAANQHVTVHYMVGRSEQI